MRFFTLLLLLVLCIGCCPGDEEVMTVTGRPFWGHRIDILAGAPVLPIRTYEVDGDLSVFAWMGAVYLDALAGWVPPRLTFCGYPDWSGPNPPGAAPVAPIRLYWSHTGNGSDWQLVDPADYAFSIVCGTLTSIYWSPNVYTNVIVDFLNTAPYQPPLGVGTVWLMWTETDPSFSARKGLSPKVTGVSPV